MKVNYSRGAWVAQSAKHSTLGSSSGHELTGCEVEPHVGLCAQHRVWLRFSLASSPSAPHHTLSLKTNRSLKKKKEVNYYNSKQELVFTFILSSSFVFCFFSLWMILSRILSKGALVVRHSLQHPFYWSNLKKGS